MVVRILSCSALLLIICGITLSLGKLEDESTKITRKVGLEQGLVNRTETELEDSINSGLTGSLKKIQKIKKRPGVSAVDFITNAPVEPHEENNTANVSESSVIIETALNMSRSDNNSSSMNSSMSDSKNVSQSFINVSIKNLIPPGKLFTNSTNKPFIKEDSEESSSAESSERSSIKENFLDSKENSHEYEVYNGSKFISIGDASRSSMENGNRSYALLAKNEMMFPGNHNLPETKLNKNDAFRNSTTSSHMPIPLLPNFTSTIKINFTKTLKIMSKPSTATMGEIGKMSSGNVVLISSIIGIICLCTLIGIIAYKRIYAYWYRRHYSRVDFLIDGLYEM